MRIRQLVYIALIGLIATASGVAAIPRASATVHCDADASYSASAPVPREVDVNVTCAEPGVGAQASFTKSWEGPYRDIDTEAGVDTDGDGDTDLGDHTDMDTDCSEGARERSVTLRTICFATDD